MALLIYGMKRLGKEKAAQLAASNPGCTLSSWLDLNYKHVTLKTTFIDGGKKLVCPQSNVELTIALLSTDNVADWARVAVHWAPLGTIIDKVPLNYYEEKVLLLRQLLTKELILNPDNKLAQRYLQVLERRDSDRWAQKNKGVSLKATATSDNAEVKNGGKEIKLEFEIVGNS